MSPAFLHLADSGEIGVLSVDRGTISLGSCRPRSPAATTMPCGLTGLPEDGDGDHRRPGLRQARPDRRPRPGRSRSIPPRRRRPADDTRSSTRRLHRSRTVIATLVLLLDRRHLDLYQHPQGGEPRTSMSGSSTSPCTSPAFHPRISERLMIRPMEEELRTIEGVKEMTGTAYEGGGNGPPGIRGRLRRFDQAMQDVREAVDRVKPDLPAEADEPTVNEGQCQPFPSGGGSTAVRQRAGAARWSAWRATFAIASRASLRSWRRTSPATGGGDGRDRHRPDAGRELRPQRQRP